jgi:competence protein ComEC
MSPIGVLSYNGFSIVFTGDATGLSETNYLADSDTLDCDVYKVAHHGASTNGSNGQNMLNDVSCEYAIISVGKDNSYGHPKEEVLDALKADNTTIYITFEVGNIVLTVSDSGVGDFSFNTLCMAE